MYMFTGMYMYLPRGVYINLNLLIYPSTPLFSPLVNTEQIISFCFILRMKKLKLCDIKLLLT